MPDNRNTDYEGAAQLTVDLVDHSHAPDCITDAILETLIEMAGESKIDIWSLDAGLNLNGFGRLTRAHGRENLITRMYHWNCRRVFMRP